MLSAASGFKPVDLREDLRHISAGFPKLFFLAPEHFHGARNRQRGIEKTPPHAPAETLIRSSEQIRTPLPDHFRRRVQASFLDEIHPTADARIIFSEARRNHRVNFNAQAV